MAASFAIEVEFSGVGGGWTDITADRLSTSMHTARELGVGPTDLVATTSTWTFSLDNSARNSASTRGYYSPNSGSVRAGWTTNIRARLRLTANGSTTTKFAGWIDTIDPLAGTYDAQSVQVMVAGFFDHAASTIVAGVLTQLLRRGDQLIATLLATMPFQPFATALAVGKDIYPIAFDDLDPETSTVLQGFQSIASSGFDRIFEKADGTLVFERRDTRQGSVTNALVLTDTAPGGQPGLAMTALTAPRSRGANLNAVRASSHPKRVDPALVVLYSLPASGTVQQIAPGASLTIQGPFMDPAQPAQPIAGTSLQALVAGTDYLMNTLPDGTGVDVTASCTVTPTFSATSASFVIANTDASRVAFLVRLQVRGIGIADYQPVISLAVNASSQASQGQNAVDLDMTYQPTPGIAGAVAAFICKVWGDPLTQIQAVSAEVPASDEVTLATLAALDISSPIALTEGQLGLSAQPFVINGERMDIDERDNVTFTWPCVPRDTVPYWQIGVVGRGEVGTTNIVAYM